MGPQAPYQSPRFRSPCWVGASRPFSWRQRLSWLISALSGTVEIEIELAKLNELNSKMDALWASPNSSLSPERSTEPG